MRGLIIGDLLSQSQLPDALQPSPLTSFAVAMGEAMLRNASYHYALRHSASTTPSLQGYPGMAAWLVQPDRRSAEPAEEPIIWAGLAGWGFDTLADAEDEAEAIAGATHSHPRTIAAARATAACVLLLRSGAAPSDVRRYLEHSGFPLASAWQRLQQVFRATKTPPAGLLATAVQVVLEHERVTAALAAAQTIALPQPALGALVGLLGDARGLPLPPDTDTVIATACDEHTRQISRLFAEQYQPTVP